MIRTAVVIAVMWLQSALAFTLRPGAARGFRTSLQQLGATKSMAEKVLENPKWPPEWPYTPQDFARMVCWPLSVLEMVVVVGSHCSRRFADAASRLVTTGRE